MASSIAGAESVVLSLDANHEVRAVMTEAPHGTAPALQGKNIANPMAMIMAVAALLHYVGDRGREEAHVASRATYEAVLPLLLADRTRAPRVQVVG